MKLITEFNEGATAVIEESNGKKNLYIEGIWAQAAKKNRNGRIYPSHILDREMNRYINEFVKTNRALGELNHPQSAKVNPDRASHRIVELHKDGNDWYGKALVLGTSVGNTVRALIEGGTQLGVSTRGLGTVKTIGGVNEIQEDYKLICADVVTDPSGIDCWVDGIMEGVEFGANGEVIEIARKKILKAPKSKLEEIKLQQFENFIRGL